MRFTPQLRPAIAAGGLILVAVAVIAAAGLLVLVPSAVIAAPAAAAPTAGAPAAGAPGREENASLAPAVSEPSAGREALPGETALPSRVVLRGGGAAPAVGVDLAGAVETVRHHVAASRTQPGALEAAGQLYRAAFLPDGMELSLRQKLSAAELASLAQGFRAARGTGSSARGRSRGEPRPLPVEAVPFEEAPAFRIGVTAMRAGATSIPLSPGAWRGEYNRALRELAPGVTERITAREAGAEWDFVLDRPLAEGGDLLIDAAIAPLEAPVTVSVGDAAGLPDQALRWPLAGGRSVTMRAMVVKDAQGYTLYRALPEAFGSGIRLVVPASALAGAAYPVTVDPAISVEYPASDPVTGLTAHSRQDSPAISWNGTNYLVVWKDARSGTSDDIYGARVSAAGAILDPVGFMICESPDDQDLPTVGWNTVNWFVAWQDFRSGSSWDIYIARVSPAGVVLDPSAVPVSTGIEDETHPRLVFGGTGFLLAWQDFRNGNDDDIYASRIGSTATVLDPAGIVVSAVAGTQSGPVPSWDGTNYFVVWQDRRSGTYDIYGARISAAGIVLDVTGAPVSTATSTQSAPDLDYDGTNYFVVWQDRRSGVNDIYGARVTPAGAVLDAAGIAISTASNEQSSPRVAFDGTDHLVVWQDRRTGGNADIYGARVSGAGVLLDVNGIPICTAALTQSLPALAWDGTNFFLVWGDDRNGIAYDVYGTRMSPAGVVVDPAGILLTISANRQRTASVAFDGTNYLAVWEDYRQGGETDIYGARVSESGAVLDATGIAISTASGDQRAPAVAWSGTHYLVAWQDSGGGNGDDIFAARVLADGTVLDGSGVTISAAQDDQRSPAVVWGGSRFLVVWQDFRNGGDWDIYGARVDTAGVVTETSGIAISRAGDNETSPAATWNGTGYFVVWQDLRNGNDDNIYGARVDATGTVLDPTGIAISTAPDEQGRPAVSWDGTNHLVVWNDYRSLSNYDVYAARVNAAGALLDATGIPVSTAANDQTSPSVVWDGWNHFVLWQDSRSGANTDIYAARVSAAGAVLPNDATGIAVATSAVNSAGPQAVASLAGRGVVVYDRLVEDAPVGSQRALLRRFYECPFDGGGRRGPCLIAPAWGAVYSAAGAAPTFTWAKGGTSAVRVEFSPNPDFSLPRVRNSNLYKSISAWTPSAKKWLAIRALAPSGSPIYWRVVGTKSGSAGKFASGDTFVFTVGP